MNSELASTDGDSVNLHIYTTSLQSATRFIDRHMEPATWFQFKPRKLIGTDCCRKRRWAKYVQVQVFYDHIARWCAEGHGCKA